MLIASTSIYFNLNFKFQIDSSSDKGPTSAFYANLPLTQHLERPALEPTLAVQYRGEVYRGTSSSRDLTQRWCHLAESQLTCYTDKSGTGSKDIIPLETVLSLQHVFEHRSR